MEDIMLHIADMLTSTLYIALLIVFFVFSNASLISSFFWCLGSDKRHLLLRNAWQISDCCHHRCYFVQLQKTFLRVWNYKEDFVIPAAGRTSAQSTV